jgi:hypothetical protein
MHKISREAIKEEGARRALEVIKLSNEGAPTKSISECVGLSHRHIRKIVNGLAWGKITGVKPKFKQLHKEDEEF